MRVHVIGDTVGRLSMLRATLPSQCAVSSELLSSASLQDREIDGVVIAVDLRNLESISALKRLSAKLNQIPRRFFLVEQQTHLSIAQAYALGATHVLPSSVAAPHLLAELSDHRSSPIVVGESISGGAAAAAGAASIAAMFRAVLTGAPVDVQQTRDAGNKIADSIAEHGLTNWLTLVRRHHEGTYQHCLLVAGVTADFGLSLGLGQTDLERLYTAAMLHDIGKAAIPVSILDQPGRLSAEERAVMQTHPVAGYEVLKGNAGITQELLDAVRHHHEYLDGSGYPDALCAESISDLVRLLTICDIFAALIEYRPYHSTMSRGDAYEILRGMEGKLEKPLVAAFKEVALAR